MMYSQKTFYLLLFCLVFRTVAIAQNPSVDLKLQKALLELTKDFKGQVGIYVHHLKNNTEAAINADTIFPTASVVKVPILAGIFKKIDSGKLKYNENLIYTEQRSYGGSGLMQFFKDSSQTDLRTGIGLMMSHSDNTTSLWNQELAGGGTEINKFMKELNLENTRVNSRTKGREKDWEKYGWGQTTPREMASLMVKIRNGEVVNKAVSEEMYRVMTHSFYTDYMLSEIPPYVQAASKQGMVNASRSELIMVNAPGGDYVVYFATKDNADESWAYNNQAWQLSREISAYLWQYFEPESSWKPAKGAQELKTGLIYRD